MVNTDKGLPDPPDNRCDESYSINNDIILGTDTDTDEEDPGYNGYEPLPLEPSDTNESLDSDDDNDENTLPNLSSNDYSIGSIENSIIEDVWSTPRQKEVDIEMDSEKVDEVKQVMRSITLPPNSVPDWASNITEEEWKQQLTILLQYIQKNKD